MPKGIKDKEDLEEKEVVVDGDFEEALINESEDAPVEDTTEDAPVEDTTEDTPEEDNENATESSFFSDDEIADYAEAVDVPVTMFTGNYATMAELKEVVSNYKTTKMNERKVPGSPVPKKNTTSTVKEPNMAKFEESLNQIVSKF